MNAHASHIHPRRKSAMAEFAADRHKRMARALGFALVLNDGAGWADFTIIARARLTTSERAALAAAALLALDPEEAEGVIEHLFGAAGYPAPALLAPMSEARLWAAAANRAELKAYVAAAFGAMTPRDQQAFRRHIGDSRRAAQ